MKRPNVGEPSSVPSPRKGRSWRRLLIYLAVLLVLVAAVGLGGVAWYCSSQLLDVAPHQLSYSQRVLALHSHSVVLTRTKNSMHSEVEGLV